MSLYEKCCAIFTSQRYRQEFMIFFQDRPKDNTEILKWFLWFWHQELLHISFRQCLSQTYQLMLDQYPYMKRIDKRYTLIYQPKKNASRYSFCWGCDPHYYGWNIVGNVIQQCLYSNSKEMIEPMYISMLYGLCECLERSLHKSHDTLKPMTISEMIPYFSLPSLMESMDPIQRWKEFDNRQSEYQKEIEGELTYPNSLFHLMYQRCCTQRKRKMDKESIFQSYISPLCKKKGIKEPFMYQIPMDIWAELDCFLSSKYQVHNIPPFFLPYVGIENQPTNHPVLYFDETTECWSPFRPCVIQFEQQTFSCPFDLFTFLIQRHYHLPICLSKEFDDHFFQPIFERLLETHPICYQLSETSFYLPEWIQEMVRYYHADKLHSKLLMVWTDLSIQMNAFQKTKKNVRKDDFISYFKLLYPEVYQKCKRLELSSTYPFLNMNTRNQYSNQHWIFSIFPFILRCFLCYIVDPTLPTFYEQMKKNSFDIIQWVTCVYLLLDQHIESTKQLIISLFSKLSFPKQISNYHQLGKFLLSKRNEGLI